MSDLERSNVGILKIETAKERLVEFVEAINDIPGMYQRCKVSDNTLLGGRMSLQNTGATTRLAILASKKIHDLPETFRIMSQDPITIKQGYSVQEIWAEALALHLGFPSYKTMDSWFLEHPMLWGSRHGLKIFSYNDLYKYNIFDTINFECITERWNMFLNRLNKDEKLNGSFFIE